MLDRKLPRALCAAIACAALAWPALASARPGTERGHGGADRAAKRNPVVTYVFKGQVARVDLEAKAVVVVVRRVNRHGRAFRGRELTFGVEAAPIVGHGGRGHGPIDLAAVSVGDRATVLARLPKRLSGDLPELVAAKGLIVKHAKSPGHKAPAGR